MRQACLAPGFDRRNWGFMRKRFARIIAPKGRGAIFSRRGPGKARLCPVQLLPK